MFIWSYLIEVRGLKLITNTDHLNQPTSYLIEVRGLKHIEQSKHALKIKSYLIEVRGLKRRGGVSFGRSRRRIL